MRIEFATVRELEKKSFRVFEYGGGALLGGLVLVFTPLAMIALPVIIVSAIAIIGAIVWVSILGKEPSRALFCPYCSSKNDVYLSRRSFDCDICRRPVLVNEAGEPLMADAIDTEARYTS